MSKQIFIGIACVFIWMILGGFEIISMREFAFGFLGFVIGAKLILWEANDGK